MIAAALIAASVLAPAGTTATIQGYPVCIPMTVQPGVTYDLLVDASSADLSIGPAHGTLDRTLNRVDPSWVRFGASSPVLLGPDHEPGVEVNLLLVVPSNAATGAYWSDITVNSPGGQGGDVSLGTAGSAAFLFTVGPSKTPPPPCDALREGYRTGQFPAWPGPEFKTNSWSQVFAQQRSARPAPGDTCPTATAGPAASSAPSYCPGAGAAAAKATPLAYAASPSPAPAQGKSPIPWDWAGWLVIAIILFRPARWVLRSLGIIR